MPSFSIDSILCNNTKFVYLYGRIIARIPKEYVLLFVVKNCIVKCFVRTGSDYKV